MAKVKAAVKLYRSDDQAMKMVCNFEERAEELGHQLKEPEPTCLSDESGDVIPAKMLNVELRAGLVSEL